jgi:integrase
MSIHKRGNKRRSVWIVRYRDPLPRERTFDRKADAERFERYVRHQLDTDQYLDPEMAKVTFEEWVRRWWPTIEQSERAPSTISGYESALRIQVLPHLGSRRLRTLRRIDMEEWLGQLRAAGYANSTIHSARTVAGMVLQSALDARIVASNPLQGIRVPTGTRRARNALSVEQVEALAETVDPWWRPYVLVLAYCGLRPGEAAALRRRHLDDLGRLTIERGMTEHRGHLLERDTKTHRTRVVQVPSSVLIEVRDHLDAHVEDDPLAFIFTTPSRTPVRISNWRHKVWQLAADELSLPKWATPYVLRHTAASLMAQRGVPVSAAAAALGHDPAIFLRTYAHLYPEDLRAVADAMDRARRETINARVTDRSQPVELVGARGKRGEESKAHGRF